MPLHQLVLYWNLCCSNCQTAMRHCGLRTRAPAGRPGTHQQVSAGWYASTAVPGTDGVTSPGRCCRECRALAECAWEVHDDILLPKLLFIDCKRRLPTLARLQAGLRLYLSNKNLHCGAHAASPQARGAHAAPSQACGAHAAPPPPSVCGVPRRAVCVQCPKACTREGAEWQCAGGRMMQASA
eukprot:356868-Chlamydomonas_euryale.AAC.13